MKNKIFNNLKVGEIFVYNDKVLLKTNTVVSALGILYNCVDISSGIISNCEENVEVALPKNIK